MNSRILAVGVVAVVAALAGAGSAVWLFGGADRQASGMAIGSAPPMPEERPSFTLSDLEGHRRSVSEWNGEVLLINFWATWCPPCRREMPMFVEVQQAFGAEGLQIVGVAIDEVTAVKAFADEYRVNFPLLVGDEDAIRVAQDYGNVQGGLPYSVIIDRSGRMVRRVRGELSRDMLVGLLRDLL